MKIVAIHQPNFFPWLGYFDKLDKANAFVILDDILIQKTGSSWVNRVRLLIGQDVRFFSAPIKRPAGFQRICDVCFDEKQPWRIKLLKTLEANYRRAPFYDEVIEWLQPLINNPEMQVAEYNITAILEIAKRIGLTTENLEKASTYHVSSQGTERLIDLTTAAGGTIYLCGGGATGYQEDERFGEATGVELRFQNYKHPRYAQFCKNDFMPGLSIIDALMNLGATGVAGLF
jgi:hypothetical protein